MIVADLARELFMELGEPEDISVPTIAFWLQTNIGQLNNLLDEDFTVESAQIVPSLNDNQSAIFKKLYEIYYFKRQINANLYAAAYTTVNEVREGNRTVRITSRNEIAKTFQSSLRMAKDELDTMILAYKMNLCEPVQVAVANPIIMEDLSSSSCNLCGCRSCNCR